MGRAIERMHGDGCQTLAAGSIVGGVVCKKSND